MYNKTFIYTFYSTNSIICYQAFLKFKKKINFCQTLKFVEKDKKYPTFELTEEAVGLDFSVVIFSSLTSELSATFTSVQSSPSSSSPNLINVQYPSVELINRVLPSGLLQIEFIVLQNTIHSIFNIQYYIKIFVIQQPSTSILIMNES